MSKNLKIAFYSPVPGSGSTLVSKAYATYLASECQEPVNLVSCDFRYSAFDNHTEPGFCLEGPVSVFLPYINKGKCILCKACARSCVFGAIKIESAISYITLKVDKCRACGACLNTCRYDAINERERVIGIWKKFSLVENIDFYEGELLAEDFFAIQLLQKVIEMPGKEGYCVIDAHSGLNYAALESLHGSDVVVMVIDPSTFTSSFYQNVITILKNYHHNIIAVINYAGNNSSDIFELLGKNSITAVSDFADLGLIKGSIFTNTELFNFQAYSEAMTALHDNILRNENLISAE